MAKILDGVALGQEVRAEVAVGVAEMQERHGVTPGLAAVLVGGDPASAIYVRNKGRACDEAGMFSEIFHLDAETTEAELLDLVAKLNADSRFHGILVQLPLPPQIEETVIIEALDPAKDVDGLHPFNLGKLLQGVPDFVSPPPRPAFSRYFCATATTRPASTWWCAVAATSWANPWRPCCCSGAMAPTPL